MKQKFTSEKNKYLENKNLKNETMFNFKISCLMKKQLISLMMVLSMVILAGTSAMAQATVVGDITAAEGSPGNPKIYIAGSTGSLSVTDEIDHTYTWNFYAGSDASTAITTVGVGADAMASGFDVSAATGTPAGLATQAGATANFTWTEAASGAFYATVTDLNTTTGCSTVRAYHMGLIGFDVVVYASLDDGVQQEGADLVGCGDGSTYPAFLNNVSLSVDGFSLRGDIMNTADTPAPIDGDLSNVHGVNPRTIKYYTAALTFDEPGSGSFANPTLGSAKMDITIGGTTMPAEDVVIINGTTLAAETDVSVDQSLVTPLAVNPSVMPTVLSEHADYYFTFAVTVNDRWGVDLTPNASVDNCRVYTEADASGTILGQEPSDKVNADNTSESYTINGKPATSIITGN
jgi:hypothetical protein